MPIVVAARTLGSRRPLFEDWSLPLTPEDFGGGQSGEANGGGGGGGLTLRDIITTIVRAELAAYATRREARRFDRVLSRAQIESGEAQGRIAPEARETKRPPPEDVAIDTALTAFEDGLYLVAIDNTEHKDLDAQVFLRPDSRITFIRLVFLAGA
ncbi:MAG: hypothetical protein AB7Q00_10325 [Phycisphaerales bacterium]